MKLGYKQVNDIDDFISDNVSVEYLTNQQYKDDLLESDIYEDKISKLFDSITRIGGEVVKMRNEIDELLEQNNNLLEAFESLKQVLNEKGQFDMDDFNLACEVMENEKLAKYLTTSHKHYIH